MDFVLFFHWVKQFILETEALRRRFGHIVLTFEGYGAHVLYESLKLMNDHNIIAIGLPAHTSHRLQVLDYTVFTPFKTYFREFLNPRAVVVSKNCRNDIYTVSQLLNIPYWKAMSYDKIVQGFKSCGVWCPKRKGILPEVNRDGDMTNFNRYEEQSSALIAYMNLVQKYQRSSYTFASDGDVLRNRVLNTTSGELLTRAEVLSSLCIR